MKKKIIFAVIVLVLLILFVPIPNTSKDKTVEYKALAYNITKIESLIEIEDSEKVSKNGLTISILDFEIFNNVKSEKLIEKQNYTKTIDNMKIELQIPEDWNYQEMEKNESNAFSKYALKLYKTNENHYAMLYIYNTQFTVCGTGRTTKNLALNNGEEALIGYYDNSQIWSDISFPNKNNKIAIINYNESTTESSELLEIIKDIAITET